MTKKTTAKKDNCAVSLGRKGGLKAKRLKLGIHSDSYKAKAKVKAKTKPATKKKTVVKKKTTAKKPSSQLSLFDRKK